MSYEVATEVKTEATLGIVSGFWDLFGILEKRDYLEIVWRTLVWFRSRNGWSHLVLIAVGRGGGSRTGSGRVVLKAGAWKHGSRVDKDLVVAYCGV